MIVLETSALVAILVRDQGWEGLFDIVLGSKGRLVLPAHCLLEAHMVLAGRHPPRLLDLMNAFLADSTPRIDPFTETHATVARAAFMTYGKGRHPAGLNFGDCMSYAVAKAGGWPLLYVGGDFAMTDVG